MDTQDLEDPQIDRQDPQEYPPPPHLGELSLRHAVSVHDDARGLLQDGIGFRRVWLRRKDSTYQ